MVVVQSPLTIIMRPRTTEYRRLFTADKSYDIKQILISTNTPDTYLFMRINNVIVFDWLDMFANTGVHNVNMVLQNSQHIEVEVRRVGGRFGVVNLSFMTDNSRISTFKHIFDKDDFPNRVFEDKLSDTTKERIRDKFQYAPTVLESAIDEFAIGSLANDAEKEIKMEEFLDEIANTPFRDGVSVGQGLYTFMRVMINFRTRNMNDHKHIIEVFDSDDNLIYSEDNSAVAPGNEITWLFDDNDFFDTDAYIKITNKDGSTETDWKLDYYAKIITI